MKLIKKKLTRLIKSILLENLWIEVEPKHEINLSTKPTNVIITVGFDDEPIISKKITL